MSNRYLINVLDYILTHEHEDFMENLSDMNISEQQKKLICYWYHDNVSTTDEVKQAFRDIAKDGNGHIYASAICLQYNIKD